MKFLRYTLFLFLLGVLFAGIKARNEFPAAHKLRMAEQAISQMYVDTVNEGQLVEAAIKAMVESLDPHSAYSNAEETRELNEPLAGNFSGIGISFNMNRDTLYVIQTVSGGPSERVGLLAGDRIIAVNDSSIAGQKLKNSAIMKKLRGPKGSVVDVTVLRRNGASQIPDTIDFRITRADIPIYSVDAAYMVEPTVGYIRINKFAAETRKEVENALNDLKKQGMQNLILDLTDNGGGYLQAAVDILGEMLDPGSLTVYTEGLNSPRFNFEAYPHKPKPLFNKGRLVVMVNQFSASASEITSGAVQDWDRGVIVGRRTFGKGLVQRPIPFPDGSMIRLTVAHYYTPTGRDIQKPYTNGNQKEYHRDILDRYNSGELMSSDSIHYVDSLKVETLRLQRPIYGGGGITPDFFVPLDTTHFTKFYRDVQAKGTLNQYVIAYVDAHRKALKSEYKSDSEFVRRFDITPEMLQQVYDMAAKEGVVFNEEEAKRSEPLFKMIIKALIGRDIYENATYFKIYNEYDPIFREALRVIRSADYDKALTPGTSYPAK